MYNNLESKLAHLLVQYSVRVQPGEVLYVEGSSEAIPLINEIYRETLRAGGHPVTKVVPEGQKYILLQEGQDQQLTWENPFDLHVVRNVDIGVRIYSDTNTRELTHISPDKLQKAAMGGAGFMRTFFERSGDPKFKWCVLPWVTTAQAMDANMANEEFAVLIEKACYLDKPDPVEEWQRISREQQTICDLLSGVDRLRIVSKETDLHLSVKGRNWVNFDGHKDLPDAEIFSAPLETSVNGKVYFPFKGRNIEGIHLTFKDGEVVEFASEKGQDHLERTMQIPGVRKIGEIGIGTNYGHQTYLNNILFDEKMGGTIHLALGSSYPETGGTNQSDLHWDLLVDMREEGEMYADGKLIYQNGHFLNNHPL